VGLDRSFRKSEIAVRSKQVEIGVPRGSSESDIREALQSILRETPAPDGVTIGRLSHVGTAPDEAGTLIFRLFVDVGVGVAADILTMFLTELARKVKVRLAGRVRLKADDSENGSESGQADAPRE
jgi:hypothetical protein